MRMYLIRLHRKLDKKSADVMVVAGSRDAAVRIVRDHYELGADYDVAEMMSWEPFRPVQITTGAYTE